MRTPTFEAFVDEWAALVPYLGPDRLAYIYYLIYENDGDANLRLHHIVLTWNGDLKITSPVLLVQPSKAYWQTQGGDYYQQYHLFAYGDDIELRSGHVDLNDDDRVAIEVGVAEDFDPDDLTISDQGGYWEANTRRRSFLVFSTDDAAHSYAVARREEDINANPEVYDPRNHLDMPKLKKTIKDMIEEVDRDVVFELDTEDFWRQAENYNELPEPELDEDNELPEPTDDQRETLLTAMADNRSQDPLGYLGEMYTEEQINKWLRDHDMFDAHALAVEIVDETGWASSLAADGNERATPGGLIYIET